MVGDRLRDQIFGGLVIGHDWHGYAIAQATEELGERKLFDIGKIENAAFAASHRMLSGDWGLRLSAACGGRLARRSEEHTSELQSLMRISYAVFCLQKKNTKNSKIQ